MTALRPPARYDDARLDGYRPQTESQAEALQKARQFVRLVRVRAGRPSWLRLFQRDDGLRGGLYLVGPVGTGKTHLLASIYHALSAPEPAAGANGRGGAEPVPCAYTHSSALFRATEPPDAYADRVAAEARVLCLDEVELDDPAGEVRLIAVLRALRERGVTLAATSNAEPERFVSGHLGRDRLERFISEEFERQYHVVFVGGDDFRQGLEKEGRAWVGAPDAARAAMRRAYEAAPEPKRWLAFDELLRLTTEVERTRLAERLAQSGALFLDGIDVADTDDALRLLRVADDLYGLPAPPTLYFTAAAPPAEWFAAEGRGGVEAAIADKFARTTSRLTALAEVERV
ncbi:AFG1/ZapE family ATPase [Rubrivirga litoralis]|uniref:AFG1/ZapE family ATPase n=1 Tax=Rubrivirga litoralis TaxID=3075598 RepID=A0ABU3BTV4_9BACT|nr:AFG1/ZapE family ATPase [Rubrivirga sp. F394]MDT0632717.1 AFG1/ZapE family ATPase [Rubrivirga sp. F394]